VRNSLIDSISGRTPNRHRRTSTMIDDLMGPAGVDDTLQLHRVNTWGLMRAIIRQSLNSVLLAMFSSLLFFAVDVAMHHAVFKDSGAAANFIGMDLDSWRSVAGYMPE